jgi:succinoglycan biosynthesis protein ExoM
MASTEALRVNKPVNVEILVCTFRRPHLRRTLESVAAQVLPAGISIGVIVVDNDDVPSARPIVAEIQDLFPYPLQYVHAPARNVSIARNAGLTSAQAPWIAFLDDEETASPGWIAALWSAAQSTGADAVFGPVLADYPCGTPGWIVRLDAHSTRPVLRSGSIETGYTGNVLLRWHGTPWTSLRFDLARGTRGGEDTEFFFAARRNGARYAFAPDATAREVVPASRLTFRWLARRRYWMGRAYVSSNATPARRAELFLSATGKAVVCGMAALATMPSIDRRCFWALRGLLHVGVLAGCLSKPQALQPLTTSSLILTEPGSRPHPIQGVANRQDLKAFGSGAKENAS